MTQTDRTLYDNPQTMFPVLQSEASSYQCLYCQEIFEYENLFKFHMTTHRRKKPCNLCVCDERLKNISHSIEHILNHAKQYYICNEVISKCSHNDPNKRSCPRHTCLQNFYHVGPNDVSSNSIQPSSSILDERGSLNDYPTHIDRPAKVRSLTMTPALCIIPPQYQCEHCHEIFKQKCHFKIHQKTHIGEKLFACQICDKRFTTKHNLKYHTRIHRGEKPFACQTCDKRFSFKCNLKDHTMIHSGEKPFTCQVCNMRFTLKNSLKDHMRKHSEEKLFTCQICDKRFTYNRSLKVHMRRKHSRENFLHAKFVIRDSLANMRSDMRSMSSMISNMILNEDTLR